MTALSASDLVCPVDHGRLSSVGDALSCQVCGHRYPVADGVIRFVQDDDPFYEGAYNNQVRFLPRREGLLYEWPLWLISNGYQWAVRRHVDRSSRVIELGCAGGVAWFGQQYQMAGVDLSREALRLAAKKYNVCLQADSMHLPFPDGFADAVTNSYFWEHIAPEKKVELLKEIWRVLRPGGHIVFVYDVATDNPLIRLLRRRRPDLYQTCFIDHDGHLGYQTAAENDDVIRAQGFRILQSNPMERSPLQSVDVYQKMAMWPGWVGALGRTMALLGRGPLFHPYHGLLRVIDETVGRLLPRSWGRIAITVAVKP